MDIARAKPDRYGYVSNNYAMAGQARAMAGGGGCGCSSHHHHHNMSHLPASQARKGAGPVIINQPMAGGTMMMDEDVRKWTTGLCGCFEHCGSCCASFCCPPCFACFLSNKMDENMCGPCCCCCFCIPLRTRLRSVGGIEGSVCKDMCTGCCCPCCVISQMYREIKNTMT